MLSERRFSKCCEGKEAAISQRLLAAGIFFVFVVTACSDSSSPSPTLGADYELTSYAGQSLPYTWRAIVATNGLDCEDEITGGRLLFGPSNSASNVLDRALVCNDGSAPVISGDTARGQYTLTGNQLDITLDGLLAGQGVSPYAVSASVAGSVITIEKIVTHTGGNTQINFAGEVYTRKD